MQKNFWFAVSKKCEKEDLKNCQLEIECRECCGFSFVKNFKSLKEAENFCKEKKGTYEIQICGHKIYKNGIEK